MRARLRADCAGTWVRIALLSIVLAAGLAGCQSRHVCVVTPKDTVECS
jgi:hypothetical protein